MASVLQNMALAQLAYQYDLTITNPETGKHWKIDELVRVGMIDGIRYDEDTGMYTATAQDHSPLIHLQTIANYKLIAHQSNTTTGFAAMAFQAPANADGTPGEIVFAFRGTESINSGGIVESMRDYIADAGIALDAQILTRTQFDDAFDFCQQTLQTVGVGNYSGYSFTGHSLGGGIAQYMTYMTNEVGHSVTFNAVGIGQVLDNVNLADYNDSVTDYVNENDVVGQYGKQLGTTVYIKDNSGYDFHQKLDDGQIALQYATIEAIKRGDLTQAQGLAVYYALSEASQHAVDAANDSKGVVFGAHGLHTMLDPQGNLMQTVQGPNAGIATLTLAIAGVINVVSIADHVHIAIRDAANQVVAEVAFAFVDGAVNVTTTVGSTVSSWVYNTGDVIADVVYNTARLVGDTANGASNTISLLYQYLFNERIYIDGTDGADTLSPILGASMVAYGREDSDTITGSGYADILDGGLGDDTISAAGGDDFLYGKIGQDTLTGDEGKDIIFGGYGNDVLYGDRVESTGLAHYAGNEDTLDGGEGDDLLEGGYGDDKYMFGRDYGHDTIYDRYRAYSYSTYGSGGSLDEIAFQSGVNPDDITLHRREASDLEVRINGTQDIVTIRDYFGAYGGDGIGAIEKMTFADGTEWNFETIKDKARTITESTRTGHEATRLYGYDGFDDIVYGSEASNRIETIGGNDIAYGRSGDDTIIGGYGNDTLYGEAGNDTIYGDREDSTGTNPYGDDVLDGGVGDDVIYGGGGNDTYVFGKGYGKDVIDDKHRSYSYSGYGSGGSLDTIALNNTVNVSDLTLQRYNAYDMKLTIQGVDDELLVRNAYRYGGIGNGSIERIAFADGTEWNFETIKDKARVITRPTYSYHSAGTLYGYDMHNDIIYGDSGTDDIKAFGGDDRIVGAAGDDTLDGAGGSDTYVFGSGWGQDVVYDGTRNSSDVDTIEFLQGILPNDVSVSRTGDDVVFSYGSTEKVTVKGYFSRYDRDGRDLGVGANKIERAVFADGTIWDQSIIEDKLRYITGTNGSDTLRGYGANEIIDGKAGNDTISGGSGNDTYMFSGNFGSDLVFDASGSDNIVFDDVRFDQLVFSRVGDDLKVVKAGSTDEVTVQYWRYSLYHIETMKDQDGRTLANTQVDQLIQSMASWSSAHGMSWSDGIANDPASVQSTVAQYWNVPTS